MCLQIICPACGSENIVKDATATWNEERRQWELSDVQDHETCNDCGWEGDEAAIRIEGEEA